MPKETFPQSEVYLPTEPKVDWLVTEDLKLHGAVTHTILSEQLQAAVQGFPWGLVFMEKITT